MVVDSSSDSGSDKSDNRGKKKRVVKTVEGEKSEVEIGKSPAKKRKTDSLVVDSSSGSDSDKNDNPLNKSIDLP